MTKLFRIMECNIHIQIAICLFLPLIGADLNDLLDPKLFELERNIAPSYISVTQSTTYTEDSAVKVVDGWRFSTQKTRDFCGLYRSNDGEPWLEIVLDTQMSIKFLTLSTHIACGWNLLHDLTITIDGQLCAKYKGSTSNEHNSTTINCSTPITGANIRISKQGYILGLCDVVVNDDYYIVYYLINFYSSPLFVYNNHLAQLIDINGNQLNETAKTLFDSSCISTHPTDQKPWWELTLDKSYNIKTLLIWSRQDYCWDPLQHLTIEVDGQLCAVYEWPLSYMEEIMHIKCDKALIGSNVRITQSGPMLQLCEVDILEDDLKDFARNYVTVNASDSWNKEYALDGFDTFRHRKASFATCLYIEMVHYKAWWEVTLDKVYSIGQLVIYTQEYAVIEDDGIMHLKITVDYTLCGTYDEPLYFSQNEVYIYCKTAISGNKVKIQRSWAHIEFCEVKIYGENIARHYVAAAQSSSVTNGKAENALDGKTSRIFTDGSCSHTDYGDKNPWWEVTLDKVYSIHRVVVVTREDCCWVYEGIRVYVNQTLCAPAVGKVEQRDSRINIACKTELSGNTVRVRHMTKKILTLCEVEIYTSNEAPSCLQAISLPYFQTVFILFLLNSF